MDLQAQIVVKLQHYAPIIVEIQKEFVKRIKDVYAFFLLQDLTVINTLVIHQD